MKILFLIGHLNGGGAERIAGELSACLELDHDVCMIIFEDQGTTYPHCHNLINIKVPGSENKGINKISNLIRRIIRVKKIKKEFEAEVTVSFMSNANIVNVLSGYSKTICSVRTVLSAISKEKVNRKIEGYVLKKANLVVTLSDGVKRDLVDNFDVPEERIKTIYNFLSTKLTCLKIYKRTRSSDKIIFCTMGRLVEAKGQWHLIKAFGEVLKVIPNARLRIFGEGPLLVELTKLAEKTNTIEKIEFCGFRENPWSNLSDCDVFVFPSLWEGFGNAIIEAMYCGLPVIAADCVGGIAEIINPNGNTDSIYGEYGILIPAFERKILNDDLENINLSENDRILSKAMIEIAGAEQWEHYHKQSLKRAKDFTVDTIKKQWIRNFIIMAG